MGHAHIPTVEHAPEPRIEPASGPAVGHAHSLVLAVLIHTPESGSEVPIVILSAMGSRETAADRASVRADRLLVQFRREIRDGRLNIGKSQEDCAREAGLDRAEWSRIERGRRTNIPLDVASRMASAVGLDMTTSYYAAEQLLRDRAHVHLLMDTRELLGPDWEWRYEVAIAPLPDRRAWDAVAVHRKTGLSIRIEAETRLRDLQGLLRKIQGKRATDGAPRVILALRASAFNRAATAEGAEILASVFPASRRAALARLRAGEDPGADVMLLVDWSRAGRGVPGPGSVTRDDAAEPPSQAA